MNPGWEIIFHLYFIYTATFPFGLVLFYSRQFEMSALPCVFKRFLFPCVVVRLLCSVSSCIQVFFLIRLLWPFLTLDCFLDTRPSACAPHNSVRPWQALSLISESLFVNHDAAYLWEPACKSLDLTSTLIFACRFWTFFHGINSLIVSVGTLSPTFGSSSLRTTSIRWSTLKELKLKKEFSVQGIQSRMIELFL